MSQPSGRSKQGILLDLLLVSPLMAFHWIFGFCRWNLFYGDTARELIFPRRILAGEIPFRDFEVFYGPLPYHITALFLKFFGNHILVDRCVSLVLLVLTLALFSWVGRELGLTRGWRLSLLVTYLVLFAFPTEGFVLFGFLMPHCLPGTYQAMLQLLMTGCVLQMVKHQKVWACFFLGLLCGVAPLFVRLDCAMGIAFFSGMTVLSPWIFFEKSSVKDRFLISMGCVLCGVLPIGAWFWATSHVSSFDGVLSNVQEIRFFLNSSTDSFVWFAFLRSGFFFIGMIAIFLILDLRSRSRLWVLLAALGISVVWFVAFQKKTLGNQFYFAIVFGGILFALMNGIILATNRRDRWNWFYAILGLGGFLFVIRAFSSAYSFYSFIYGGSLVLLAVFVGLKKIIDHLLLNQKRFAVQTVLIAVCGWAFVLLTVSSFKTYRENDFPVENEWGVLWMKKSLKAQQWKEVSDFIKSVTKPKERIYSYQPNNVIYALSARLPAEYDQDGTRWKSEPQDGVLCSFAEKRMIAQVEKHHVNWMVLDNSGYSVDSIRFTQNLYRKGLIKNSNLFLGRDEAPDLTRWIELNFQSEKHWGGPLVPDAKEYGIEVLKRSRSS